MAIGARSQSARTYLEKNLDCFQDGKTQKYLQFFYTSPPLSLSLSLASLDELIDHGLLALRECLPNDAELTSKVR